MGDDKSNPVNERQRMVEYQLRLRGIHDERILQAFAEVPRERFIPPHYRDEAYEDHPLPIGHNQTISQPYIVALMVQELCPQPHHRVLDVGAGSGYQSAVLARLVRHVYAIERLGELADRATQLLAELGITNASVHTADGTLGLGDEAPFDGIICGAAAPQVPQPWIDQLADGGRIVVPVGEVFSQSLLVLHKQGDRIRRREICGVRFVRLIGEHGWPEP